MFKGRADLSVGALEGLYDDVPRPGGMNYVVDPYFLAASFS